MAERKPGETDSHYIEYLEAALDNMQGQRNSWRETAEIMKGRVESLESALETISNMRVNDGTDHAQLSALCIAIAKTTI